jgi:hypothetical protein
VHSALVRFLLSPSRFFSSILRWFSLGPEKLAENGGETEKRAFSSSGPLRVPFFGEYSVVGFFSTSKHRVDVFLIKLFFRIAPDSIPNLVHV